MKRTRSILKTTYWGKVETTGDTMTCAADCQRVFSAMLLKRVY
jgi:hypothetical protein